MDGTTQFEGNLNQSDTAPGRLLCGVGPVVPGSEPQRASIRRTGGQGRRAGTVRPVLLYSGAGPPQKR